MTLEREKVVGGVGGGGGGGWRGKVHQLAGAERRHGYPRVLC